MRGKKVASSYARQKCTIGYTYAGFSKTVAITNETMKMLKGLSARKSSFSPDKLAYFENDSEQVGV